jgi:hypothetical protein
VGSKGKLPTQAKWFLQDDFANHFPHPVSQVGTLASSNREEMIWIPREGDVGG